MQNISLQLFSVELFSVLRFFHKKKSFVFFANAYFLWPPL